MAILYPHADFSREHIIFVILPDSSCVHAGRYYVPPELTNNQEDSAALKLA